MWKSARVEDAGRCHVNLRSGFAKGSEPRAAFAAASWHPATMHRTMRWAMALQERLIDYGSQIPRTRANCCRSLLAQKIRRAPPSGSGAWLVLLLGRLDRSAVAESAVLHQEGSRSEGMKEGVQPRAARWWLCGYRLLPPDESLRRCYGCWS